MFVPQTVPSHQMVGNLVDARSGQTLMRAGFMGAMLPHGGLPNAMQQFAPNSTEAQLMRGEGMGGGNAGAGAADSDLAGRFNDLLQRGDISGDLASTMLALTQEIQGLQRGITSATSNFPVRENLEAPAALLVPVETPFRNMLPRVPGAGASSQWRQLTSLGGGWGSGYDQSGGQTAIRAFYSEVGAPVEHTSTYLNKVAAFKLLGALGSVTNFAMAAGANYQDQLGTERRNALMNTMLNEEFALVQGDATSTAVPWGDGIVALAFDGIMKLVSTANGTPSAQIQTMVGPLTTGFIDAQLAAISNQGGRGQFMLINQRESVALTALLQKTGSIQRLQIDNQGAATLGFHVAKYTNPLTGEMVDIITDRYMNAGEMIFGARYMPDGSNAIEVEVLPQVPVDTAPEKPQQIQGYAVTDLARSLTQPDVHPFMISVYEVLKLRDALVFAKATGVTAPV